MMEKDPRERHFQISIIKSGFRLVAGGLLMASMFPAAGAMFIIAELLGIAEEL